MTDKCKKKVFFRCKKKENGGLVLCVAALYAEVDGFIRTQHVRDFEADKLREQISIVKGKQSAPLRYCPWCGSNIDTTPRDVPKDAE